MASSKSLGALACKGVLLAALFIGTAHGLEDGCEDTSKGETCEDASLIQARSQQRILPVHAGETSQSTVQPLQLEAEPGSQEADGCGVVGSVLDLLRGVINSEVKKRLKEKDPVDVHLGSGDQKIKLPGCDVDIALAASVSIAGLSTGGITSLECSSAVCLKKVFGVCTKSNVTLKTTVGLGNLAVTGSVDADWALCGKNIPNKSIKPNFNISGASVTAAVSADVGFGLRTTEKITNVEILSIDWGTADNFGCEVDGIPVKVGEFLAGWCADISSWIVKNIWKYLPSEAEDVFKALEKLGVKDIGKDVESAV